MQADRQPKHTLVSYLANPTKSRGEETC